VEALVRGAVVSLFGLRLLVEGGLVWLDLRRTAAAGPRVPPALEGRVSPELLRRSHAYTIARRRFALAFLAWDAVVGLLLLLSGALPAVDAALGRMGLAGGWRFVAFLLGLAAATSIASLPFSLHGTFVLEARFGFNRTTPRTWLADRAKGAALALAIGTPILWGAWLLMESTGGLWWLWVWGFLSAVQLFLLWLYPSVLAPIFNRFSPLPDGPLRDRLLAVARDAGFRTRGLFVMDASRRSGHSNAYFAGLVRPRIVLFDTLVSTMTVDEAAAVLAHEVGHYRLRHVARRLATGLCASLAGLGIASLLVRWPPFFQAFGFEAPSWGPAVALVSLAGGAFTFPVKPLASLISRRHEFAADRYAVAHGGGADALGRALVKLHGENLSSLDPHPWFRAWYASHPTLLERLAALERLTGAFGGVSSPRPAAARSAATQTDATAETGSSERCTVPWSRVKPG
jgi:STE24 endopeptidase